MARAILSDVCAVEGCERLRKINYRKSRYALCAAHRKRLELHGDVLAHIPIRAGSLKG